MHNPNNIRQFQGDTICISHKCISNDCQSRQQQTPCIKMDVETFIKQCEKRLESQPQMRIRKFEEELGGSIKELKMLLKGLKAFNEKISGQQKQLKLQYQSLKTQQKKIDLFKNQQNNDNLQSLMNEIIPSTNQEFTLRNELTEQQLNIIQEEIVTFKEFYQHRFVQRLGTIELEVNSRQTFPTRELRLQHNTNDKFDDEYRQFSQLLSEQQSQINHAQNNQINQNNNSQGLINQNIQVANNQQQQVQNVMQNEKINLVLPLYGFILIAATDHYIYYIDQYRPENYQRLQPKAIQRNQNDKELIITSMTRSPKIKDNDQKFLVALFNGIVEEWELKNNQLEWIQSKSFSSKSGTLLIQECDGQIISIGGDKCVYFHQYPYLDLKDTKKSETFLEQPPVCLAVDSLDLIAIAGKASLNIILHKKNKPQTLGQIDKRHINFMGFSNKKDLLVIIKMKLNLYKQNEYGEYLKKPSWKEEFPSPVHHFQCFSNNFVVILKDDNLDKEKKYIIQIFNQSKDENKYYGDPEISFPNDIKLITMEQNIITLYQIKKTLINQEIHQHIEGEQLQLHI